MVRTRGWAWTLLLAMAGVAAASPAAALTLRDRPSPRNRERPARRSTRFIILHTTEGAGRGALSKLRRNGEAHYLVMRSGVVYRIVDKHRVAYHAGRSMWAGHEDLDRTSIGIEVVGYHHRSVRPKQVSALRELVGQLRRAYGIPAERVLTHAHVAYGTPNRYHRYRHRGRKRCGMNLASRGMRTKLGLGAGPVADPDVSAGRLAVADRGLRARLYAKGSRARPAKDKAIAKATPRPKPSLHRRRPPPEPALHARGPTPKRAPSDRTCHRVRSATSARALVGRSYASSRTVYLFPNGLVRTGTELSKDRKRSKLLERLPTGTRVLSGVKYGGYLKPHRPPSVVCGNRWNDPDSVYRLPGGRLMQGHQVRPTRLPRGTMAFCAT